MLVLDFPSFTINILEIRRQVASSLELLQLNFARCRNKLRRFENLKNQFQSRFDIELYTGGTSNSVQGHLSCADTRRDGVIALNFRICFNLKCRECDSKSTETAEKAEWKLGGNT